MARSPIVAIVAGSRGGGLGELPRPRPGQAALLAQCPTSSTVAASPEFDTFASSAQSILDFVRPALRTMSTSDQMHRTATGGWLLTGSRLLVTDGSRWWTCWTSSNGNLAAPYQSPS